MADQKLPEKLLRPVVLLHLDLENLSCFQNFRITPFTEQAGIHTRAVVMVLEGIHAQLSIGSAMEHR
jgi:hypothetical protein